MSYRWTGRPFPHFYMKKLRKLSFSSVIEEKAIQKMEVMLQV